MESTLFLGDLRVPSVETLPPAWAALHAVLRTGHFHGKSGPVALAPLGRDTRLLLAAATPSLTSLEMNPLREFTPLAILTGPDCQLITSVDTAFGKRSIQGHRIWAVTLSHLPANMDCGAAPCDACALAPLCVVYDSLFAMQIVASLAETSIDPFYFKQRSLLPKGQRESDGLGYAAPGHTFTVKESYMLGHWFNVYVSGATPFVPHTLRSSAWLNQIYKSTARLPQQSSSNSSSS